MALAERISASAEIKFQALFESSLDGLLIADDRGRYLAANPAACALLGMTRESILELCVEDFADPRRKEEIRRSWRQFLHDGKQKGLFRVYRPNGTTRHVDYTAIAHILPNQNLAIFRDITERDQAERSLRDSEDRLRRALEAARMAAEAKTQFIANISHEIRTPINGLIAAIELLRTTMLSPDQEEYADIMDASSRTLMVLIGDLLDFSRMEAGRLKLDIRKFDLIAMLHTAVSAFEPRAQSKKLKVGVWVNPSIPSFLWGDPVRLRQVLMNLIGNAVKFTPKGKIVVRVTIEKEESSRVVLKFSVQDTGPGVPKRQQVELFKPFSQGDASSARSHGGSGLGLAISKQIMELMGGSIGLKSSRGNGSTFWFSVPLQKRGIEDRAQVLKRAATFPLKASTTQARILIAEDNLINRTVALRQLHQLGFNRVETAKDGRHVLRMLKAQTFDVILMDCQMPSMDGYQTAMEIRRLETRGKSARRRRVPIIAMTAHAMEEDRLKCLAAGMDDYLSKPVQLSALNDALSRWLEPASKGISKTPIIVLNTPAGGGAALPFDKNQLKKIVPLDAPGFNEFIELYFSDMEDKIQQLESYVRSRALSKIREVAHSALGASRMLGMTAISEVLGHLENAASKGPFSHVQRLLSRSQSEFERLKDCVYRLKKKESAC